MLLFTQHLAFTAKCVRKCSLVKQKSALENWLYCNFARIEGMKDSVRDVQKLIIEEKIQKEIVKYQNDMQKNVQLKAKR